MLLGVFHVSRFRKLLTRSVTEPFRRTAAAFRPQVEHLEDRSVPSAGDLDPNFGSGGIVLTDLSGNSEQVQDMVIQPDGKIVVVADGDGTHKLVRYQIDGSLDPTFGQGGIVVSDPYDSSSWDPYDPVGIFSDSLALQPDGKLVVGGSIIEWVPEPPFGEMQFVQRLALRRYNADGTLDTTFGSQGTIVEHDWQSYGALDVVVQPNGKIVVVGNFYEDRDVLDDDFLVLCYLPDGTPDPGFGQAGRATLDFGGYDIPTAVALKPDGTIVLGGYTVGNHVEGQADFAVAAFTPSGKPDTSFGSGGRATADYHGGWDYAHALAIQSDGKIVLAGGHEDRIPEGYRLAGREVRLPFGSTALIQDFAVARFTADGMLDDSFGNGGRVTTHARDYQVANGVVVQRNGKIVAAGYASHYDGNYDYDFTLVRYNPDGTLDSGIQDPPLLGGETDSTPGDSFGNGGVVTTDLGSTSDRVTALALQDDGMILAAGFTTAPSRVLALARYEGDPVPAPPRFAISDVTVTESNGGTLSAIVTVTLHGSSPQPVTVQYATADGTARAGSDYAAISGTLTFQPGEGSKTITVPVFGDICFEPDETFFVNLSNPTAGTLLAKSQGRGTILNDDSQPTLAITDVQKVEGNAGTTAFVFTIDLSNPHCDSVTVNYATADGTAIAGSDYTATSGTLTFNPGETTKSVTVAVQGDTIFEPNETFSLTLSAATNATLTDSQGVATIINDDSQPRVRINDVSIREGKSGRKAFVFTISLTNASSETITLNYTTADGTAKANEDYESTSGTLTFAPGETTKTVTVWVYGDKSKENDETFFLILSGVSNAGFDDDQAMGIILDDDR